MCLLQKSFWKRKFACAFWILSEPKALILCGIILRMIWKSISEAKPFTFLRPKHIRKLYRKDVYIRHWLLAASIDYVYIRPWPTECKTGSGMRNIFKTYIYVFGLQNEISSAESRVHPGCIYTSLARKGLKNAIGKLLGSGKSHF